MQKLTLIGAHWDYGEQDERSFASLFSPVTTLKLRRCQYHSLSNFVNFISVFPSLRELELDEITWDRDSDLVSLPTHLSGQGLRRLTISGSDLGFVAPVGRWLKGLSRDSLRDFRLSWENTAPEGEKSLKSLLECLRSSLVHLDINTEAFSMGELGMRRPFGFQKSLEYRRLMYPFSIDRHSLETIVGLRTLTLGKLFLIEDHGPEVHPEIEQISNLLSHTDLRGFSQLVLSCVVAGRTIHSLFVIDNVLSQKQFPGLSRVVIEVQDTLERNGVHRKILEALPDRMPSLAARGILSMRCGTLSWICRKRLQL